jgi:hypothetical protein
MRICLACCHDNTPRERCHQCAWLLIGITAFRNSTHRLAPFAMVLLCSCAVSTGVLPAGPDTYTLTERLSVLRGGSDGAQATALTKANQFCGDQHRQFVPAVMGTNPPSPQGPSYTVTFRCVLPNDPALAGYHGQPAPNAIVEQRKSVNRHAAPLLWKAPSVKGDASVLSLVPTRLSVYPFSP